MEKFRTQPINLKLFTIILYQRNILKIVEFFQPLLSKQCQVSYCLACKTMLIFKNFQQRNPKLTTFYYAFFI